MIEVASYKHDELDTRTNRHFFNQKKLTVAKDLRKKS